MKSIIYIIHHYLPAPDHHEDHDDDGFFSSFPPDRGVGSPPSRDYEPRYPVSSHRGSFGGLFSSTIPVRSAHAIPTNSRWWCAPQHNKKCHHPTRFARPCTKTTTTTTTTTPSADAVDAAACLPDESCGAIVAPPLDVANNCRRLDDTASSRGSDGSASFRGGRG